jgi:outer membrane lipoprotein LolB
MNARCALVLAALCSACAHVPTASAPAIAAISGDDATRLAVLGNWHASGRLAVQSAQGGWNASFDWQQAAPGASIEVHGPFGAGATRIIQTGQSLRIESATGTPLELTPPYAGLDAALRERLGASLPLDQLRYWLLGVPSPAADAPTGGARSFIQAGWSVRTESTMPVANAPVSLPHRLTLEQGTTRIRVLVDAWQVAPP